MRTFELGLFRTLESMAMPYSVKAITLFENLRLPRPVGEEDVTNCDILLISSRVKENIKSSGNLPIVAHIKNNLPALHFFLDKSARIVV
jgi:hypothetical protein